jgi:hypothetical protein
MVKCTKKQIRRLKTALHWKGHPEQRQRIQMVLLRTVARDKTDYHVHNRPQAGTGPDGKMPVG